MPPSLLNTSIIPTDNCCLVDVEKYGFLALNSTGRLNDIDTLWGSNDTYARRLGPPALNISAFYMSPAAPFYGNTWVDPRTKTRPFASYMAARTVVRGTMNTTYSMEYMQDHGSCQPLEVGLFSPVSSHYQSLMRM